MPPAAASYSSATPRLLFPFTSLSFVLSCAGSFLISSPHTHAAPDSLLTTSPSHEISRPSPLTPDIRHHVSSTLVRSSQGRPFSVRPQGPGVRHPFILFDPLLIPSRYFVNDQDEIRSIENPDCYFKFFINKNARTNERQRFGFNRKSRFSLNACDANANRSPRGHRS